MAISGGMHRLGVQEYLYMCPFYLLLAVCTYVCSVGHSNAGSMCVVYVCAMFEVALVCSM